MTISNLWKFLKDRTLLCILSATPHLDVKNLSVDTFSSSSIKLYRGHHTTRQHFFHRNVTTTKPRGHIEFLHHFDELVLRTMRLLTHNLLACHAKACATTSNNFPLILKDVQLELIEAEPNEIFIKGFLPKLDWPALVKTARSLGDTTLPDQGPDPSKPLEDEALIKLLHHVLLEVSCSCNLSQVWLRCGGYEKIDESSLLAQ